MQCDRPGEGERLHDRWRAPGQALLFFQALVERNVWTDRDRSLRVEGHREACSGVGQIAGPRFGRPLRGDRFWAEVLALEHARRWRPGGRLDIPFGRLGVVE